MKGPVVFDFDKTLTDSDTLFGFYKSVAGSDLLFFPKRAVLIAAAILYKSGLINNNTLKRIGIFLFLKGRSQKEMEIAAYKYSKQIELNDIYLHHYQKTDGEKWVVSASPEIYLKLILGSDRVAGTTFTYRDEKVEGLDVNMFGWEKRRFLNKKGIHHISEFYTDSLTDKPLIDIAQKVYIVENGEIRIFETENTKDSL